MRCLDCPNLDLERMREVDPEWQPRERCCYDEMLLGPGVGRPLFAGLDVVERRLDAPRYDELHDDKHIRLSAPIVGDPVNRKQRRALSKKVRRRA